MRAVDTDVLIRLITRDDAKRTAVADKFVSADRWMSHNGLSVRKARIRGHVKIWFDGDALFRSTA